jgi:hypothetical protein
MGPDLGWPGRSGLHCVHLKRDPAKLQSFFEQTMRRSRAGRRAPDPGCSSFEQHAN